MKTIEGTEALTAVQIDENKLDQECVRLPGDYLKAATHSADCKAAVDEAKNTLKVAEADMAKDIRERPGQYGLEKVTEAAVKELTIGSKPYQAAAKALRDAEYEAELAQALVWAFQHKKNMVEKLIDLHGMGYFAAPKVSENGKRAVERQRETARGGRGYRG